MVRREEKETKKQKKNPKKLKNPKPAVSAQLRSCHNYVKAETSDKCTQPNGHLAEGRLFLSGPPHERGHSSRLGESDRIVA